jgi:hypothetical protein
MSSAKNAKKTLKSKTGKNKNAEGEKCEKIRTSKDDI